jgi:hypothetical protein
MWHQMSASVIWQSPQSNERITNGNTALAHWMGEGEAQFS